ncbi:hypothetical protein KI387_014074, partial [Taxus chinensis]
SLADNTSNSTSNIVNDQQHAEFLDLKNKHEEFKTQQENMKQQDSWAQVVKGKGIVPPLAAVEEVVQAKLIEERTRHARELNLK